MSRVHQSYRQIYRQTDRQTDDRQTTDDTRICDSKDPNVT